MTEACGIDYPSDYRLSCWWCDTFFPPLFFSQGRISRLVEDLNDERSSADCLMERLDKTKEQAGSHPYSFSFFFLVANINNSHSLTEYAGHSVRTQPSVCFLS